MRRNAPTMDHAVYSRRAAMRLLAGGTLLATAAASGIRRAAAKGEDATQLLSAAAAAMTALKSFQFELTTVQGKSTILRNLELVGVEGAVQRPDSFEATITAKVAIVNVDVDVVGIGGRLWVTDPLAKDAAYIEVTGAAGDELQAQTLSALINPDRLLLAAVGLVESPVVDGTETIDGDKTTRVVGTVDLNRIQPLQLATPVAGSEFDKLILGEMPITIWVDADDRVRSLEVEGPLTTDESPDVVRRLDLFDFDQPVEIAEPENVTTLDQIGN